jgi:hypothetical protein
MAPTIFKDIGHQKIKERSDLLAIAANSCHYSVWLDSKSLMTAGRSLQIQSPVDQTVQHIRKRPEL